MARDRTRATLIYAYPATDAMLTALLDSWDRNNTITTSGRELALKLAGQPIPDDAAGPLTWSIWFRKAGKV